MMLQFFLHWYQETKERWWELFVKSNMMTLMSHDLSFKAQPVRERLKDNYKLHSVILSYPCSNTNKLTSEIYFCLTYNLVLRCVTPICLRCVTCRPEIPQKGQQQQQKQGDTICSLHIIASNIWLRGRRVWLHLWGKKWTKARKSTESRQGFPLRLRKLTLTEA